MSSYHALTNFSSISSRRYFIFFGAPLLFNSSFPMFSTNVTCLVLFCPEFRSNYCRLVLPLGQFDICHSFHPARVPKDRNVSHSSRDHCAWRYFCPTTSKNNGNGGYIRVVKPEALNKISARKQSLQNSILSRAGYHCLAHHRGGWLNPK